MFSVALKIGKSPIVLRLIAIVCSFITTILINRTLGIELKGEYTTIYSYANFIQLALNLGLCYAYVNIKNIFEENAKVILTTIIWGQALILLFIFIIVYTISNYNFWIFIVSLLLICDNQITFLAVIDDIYKRNRIMMDISLIYIIFTIVSFLFYQENINIVLFFLAIKLVLEIIWISFKFNYFHFNIRCLKFSIMKKVFSIGIPTAVLAVLISCNYNIDIFIMNFLQCNNTEIGIFGVAYGLSNMLWVLPDAFKELVYNKTAKSTSSQSILILIFINVLICILICVAFIFLGKIFLDIFYGEDYVQAFSTTLILFIGVIPMVSFKLIHPVYVNEGKSMVVVKILMVSIVSNIIASFILIPKFQSLGAALSSVISYSLCSLLFIIKFFGDYNLSKIDIKNIFLIIKNHINR